MLHSQMIPFISYGGYDLFPVGTWVNAPGKVIIQYLSIIQPDEATSRDNMIRLLRRRMLIALMVTPEHVGDSLSLWEFMRVYIVGVFVLAFNVMVTRSISTYFMSEFSLTSSMAFLYFILLSALITVILYIYYVYVTPLMISEKEKSK